jgi:hypothetical protein
MGAIVNMVPGYVHSATLSVWCWCWYNMACDILCHRTRNRFSSFQYMSSGPITDMQDPQEVVSYCESRFRAILNALQAADGDKERWIEDGLKKELVSKIQDSKNKC